MNTTIKEVKSERAGDSYFQIKHSSGLNIYVYCYKGKCSHCHKGK